METLSFRSRIDVGLFALIFVPFVLVLGLVVQSALAEGSAPPISVYATFGASIAFVVWLFATTAYHVSTSELVARAGPLRVRVPLDQITTIRRSNSVMSAPALSLKRLEVTYGRGKAVLISPDDEEGFFDAMKKRAPQAELPEPGLE